MLMCLILYTWNPEYSSALFWFFSNQYTLQMPTFVFNDSELSLPSSCPSAPVLRLLVWFNSLISWACVLLSLTCKDQFLHACYSITHCYTDTIRTPHLHAMPLIHFTSSIMNHTHCYLLSGLMISSEYFIYLGRKGINTQTQSYLHLESDVKR